MNDESYQLVLKKMRLSELPESRPNYLPLSELSKVKEIHMRQGIISSAKSTHPIIATDGIISCVGVVGYSKESQRGFLAHIDALTDRQPKNKETTHNSKVNLWAINTESDIMINSLETVALWGIDLKKPSQYEVILMQNGNDKKLFTAVERSIEHLNKKYQGKLFLNVVERDLSYRRDSKNIALDLRTGEMHSYSYSINNIFQEYHNLKPVDNTKHTRLELGWPSSLNWTIDDSIKN